MWKTRACINLDPPIPHLACRSSPSPEANSTTIKHAPCPFFSSFPSPYPSFSQFESSRSHPSQHIHHVAYTIHGRAPMHSSRLHTSSNHVNTFQATHLNAPPMHTHYFPLPNYLLLLTTSPSTTSKRRGGNVTDQLPTKKWPPPQTTIFRALTTYHHHHHMTSSDRYIQ